MTQTNLSPQTRELISRLYSSNEYNKREAIYRILFDRRIDLLPELKKAVRYEKNETIAVFMVQVCLTLTSFPRDSTMERRILEILQYEEGGKVNDLTPTMWKYLENSATSQMIIAILASMGNSIPANSYDFIEMCLTHPDPEVRTMVCEKAIKSGRPSHFAYVLNLVVDKDPIVSQTAFAAIKNLPESELSIILDYALGSPDEWVLNTVAPFLPNLITNNLRSVIAKVQYHSNQNIARKAREALKVLDAIPYITKRSLKDHDEAEKRKAEEKEKKKKQEEIEESQKVSLKEQLEQKRKEQEEKDRIIREANEALDREIAAIDSSEMDAFSKAIDNYDSVLPVEENVQLDDNQLPEEKTFIDNTDFSLEANAFSEIDENKAKEAVSDIMTVDQLRQQEDEKAFLEAMAAVKEKEETGKVAEPSIPNENDNDIELELANLEKSKKQADGNSADSNQNIKIEESNQEKNDAPLETSNTEDNISLELDLTDSVETDLSSVNEDINKANDVIAENAITNTSLEENADNALDLDALNFDNASQFLDADSLDLGTVESNSSNSGENIDFNFDDTLQSLDDIKVEEVDLSSLDLASASKSLKEEANENEFESTVKEAIEDAISENGKSADNEKKQIEIETKEKPIPVKANQLKAENKNQTQIQASNKTHSSVSVPSNTKDIFEKYPSFLTDPLLEVFKAATNEKKLKAIDNTLTNLTAFLNICFLQSCLYYAQESEMLAKSIKDCIKGNLTGPSAIRCLHNFVLAMKAVRGNNQFFAFQLSKIMGNSQDETNPLMLMRELKEYLKEPEEPLEESVPQAVEGLIEILKGIRYINSNPLVMRAPRGAKLPYADLSGPVAKALSKDKLPSMDLPVGEVILISTDGAEAFGLFPFFKYQKKKVVFGIPTSEELATFYERLEITP